jgi:hypothetical protein
MSNNLSLSQVAAAQNQKEITINDQAGQLDAALTEVLTIAVDDSNAYVLTDTEFRRSFFIVVTEGSPAPTAAIAVQAPAIRRGLFKLLNLTAQTVTIAVAGQSESAPQIPAGENRMLSCDGSDVRAAGIALNLGGTSVGELLDVDISGIAAGQQLSWNGAALVPVTEPFDLGLHLPDLSTAGALLAEIVLARPVDFPAAFTGSTGYARIAAATAETVLDVQKNGSNIGTVTFAAAGATPTFGLASSTSFAAGDRLGIVNEDPADATLAGVSLTFAGTRGS